MSEVQGQPAQQDEGSKELTLVLTVNEANAVLAGLGELPAKYVNGLITKIQQQAAVQLQPQAAE